MKTYELKPTNENVLDVFLNDKISRNKDVFIFSDLLNSIENNCSIAVDGDWGSGKTFFIKQVKMFIEANNNFIDENFYSDKKEAILNKYKQANPGKPLDFQQQVCVYYDAWENDNDDDPILSLIFSILQDVDSNFKLKNPKDFLKIGASLINLFTKKDWGAVVNSLNSASGFDSIKESKNKEQQIKDFLNTILEEKGNRLIIFIDELDRCKPAYAVNLLERIKHYFSNDNITFVFSVNTKELQHTIKKYYGEGFDAGRYLERFFDLRISLPPADMDAYLATFKFEKSYIYDEMCREVINHYNFSIREAAKYIQITKIAAYSPTHENKYYGISTDKAFIFCLLYIVPIMIGLKIHDIDMYNNFINGKDYKPLLDFSYCIDGGYLSELCCNNESFDDKDGKTTVSVDAKLQDVYNALFNQKYDNYTYHKFVGKLEFIKKTKSRIENIAGLMSHDTNFNID